MSRTKVSFEIIAEEPSTYGAELARFADIDGIITAGIDFRTPSSASTPRIELTFASDRSDVADAIANVFGLPHFAAFVHYCEPEVEYQVLPDLI